MENYYYKWRSNRFLNLLVINLRYVLGIGFLPSGMVKIFNDPFTNPENTGAFAEFLHALYATGPYYQIVGLMQVLAAVLLITQRFATLGAALFLPIIFNIAVLTLSTIGSLTPLIALLMLLGIIFLLLWDAPKWINIFAADNRQLFIPKGKEIPTYNRIHFFTGVVLLLLPSLFWGFSLPGAGFAAMPLILIFGNLISEYRFPVFRKTFSNRN